MKNVLNVSVIVGVTSAVMGSPLPALASENVPEGTFDMILRTTEALGPLGPAFFIGAVILCECIPLFPTTPLSLASGILFGAQKGAICILGGTTIASILAFSIARGIGRPLAEKIINAEMSGDEDDHEQTVVQKKLEEVQHAIERGTFLQQAGAVLALRLTPIVPFSASNYVLGLSPLPLAPYLTGTFIGMSFWSVVYASLGGASRVLLSKGVDPDVLLGDLLEATGSITGKAGIAVGLCAIAALAVYANKEALVFPPGEKTSNNGTSTTNVINTTETAE